MPVISLCWPSEISRPGQRTRGVNPCKACVGLSDGGKQGLPKAVFFLHQLSAASPCTRTRLRVMPRIAGCSKTSLGARQLKVLDAPAWAASWDPLKKGKKNPKQILSELFSGQARRMLTEQCICLAFGSGTSRAVEGTRMAMLPRHIWHSWNTVCTAVQTGEEEQALKRCEPSMGSGSPCRLCGLVSWEVVHLWEVLSSPAVEMRQVPPGVKSRCRISSLL